MSVRSRLLNPLGRSCGCPPECVCRRTRLGRLLRWYVPARFHARGAGSAADR